MEGNINKELLLSYRMIVYGCRSLVLAQCGYKDQALECADKSIQSAKSIKTSVVYFAMALGLTYALQVCKSLGSSNLLNEGMNILDPFRTYYPIVCEIMNILSSDTYTFNTNNLQIKEESKIKGQNLQIPLFIINSNPNPYFSMHPSQYEENNQMNNVMHQDMFSYV